MVWKTCLRVAWARRIRPACSISQRSCRLPWPLRRAAYCSTCFQAGPVRSAAKRSSSGHRSTRSSLMAPRLASSRRSASSCRASGRRMGKASGWVVAMGCLLRHGWSVPGLRWWSWASTKEPHSHRAELPLTISPGESTPSPGTSNECSILWEVYARCMEKSTVKTLMRLSSCPKQRHTCKRTI